MTCQVTNNGWRCEKNKIVTFSAPVDANNPLSTFNWTIDGSPASTSQQFMQTFLEPGTHTVQLNGANNCGSGCQNVTQLEIVDALPSTTMTASTSGLNSVMPIVIAVGVALVGMVISKR